MDTLTVSARIYLAFVALTALALTSWLTLVAPPSSDDSLYIGIVIIMTMLAYRFPISFGFKRRIYLDVVAIGTAAMILDPGPAALAIGIGAVGGQLLKIRMWDECAFNASQSMLQTIAGGLLLGWISWDADGLVTLEPKALLGLVALTLTIFAINSVLLAGIIGLQSGISPFTVLADSGTSIVELAVQATQVAAAIVATMLIMANVWLAALMIVPCGGLYWLLRRNVQNQKFAMIGMLETLADLVDYRDPYTATHARRVAAIAHQIAGEMGLPQEQVDLISMAARFHNLGSLTFPTLAAETVGGLHSDEWNVMRQVPAMSADLLFQFPETALAGELVRHHLERYDGEGYPDGLAGEEIPLGSRIISVADSIDAMARHRPYRPALAATELRDELERFRGTQWDPEIVDIALRMIDSGTLRLTRPDDAPDESLPPTREAASRTIEQQIQHQAFHDPLTDLPNRLLLMNRLSRGLTGDGRRFAVLFIDLDGFKTVNDKLGHRTGDQVLIEATRRIRAELDSGDTLARLGGDEFVVLLWDIRDADHAASIAGRLIASLGAPLADIDESLTLAASIGIALARPGVDTPDDLLHRADGAMYAAKRGGRARAAIAEGDRRETDIASQVAG